MSPEHFEDSLRAMQQRTPFRPFTIELVSGVRVEVDFPDAILVRDGMAVYIAPGGAPTLFDHESISQIIGDLTEQPS